MGVWYRTIATSASAALTLCLVMAGEVMAAPVAARSTTPESEIQADISTAQPQGADISEPAARATEVESTEAEAIAVVKPADVSSEVADLESADAPESAGSEAAAVDGTNETELEEDSTAVQSSSETELAIAPDADDEVAGADEAAVTEVEAGSEPEEDAPLAAEPVGDDGDEGLGIIPAPVEPLPVEPLGTSSDDGVPTADILQGGDLTPLESNPNPLQYPTLPEEVRLVLRQPITLEQALELARRNSRVLENARLNLEQAQHGLKAAIAARYPQVNLNANLLNSLAAGTRLTLLQNNDATRQAGGTDLVEDPADRNADATSYTLSLQLTYNIYSSGQRLNQIRAARSQVKSGEYALESAFEDVRFSVTNAYYSLQQETEQLRIDQASVGFREQNVKDAQALETAGLGTRFEVLQAEVELANDRQLVEQTRSRLLQARRELARQLSLPEAIDIAAADPVEKVGDWSLGLEESIIAAYRNRAELAQQLAQRDVAEAQRRALRAQDGPQVTAVAQYDLFDTLSPRDNFGPVYGYSASLQFSWNVFDGGGDRARAAQQDAVRRQAENQFAIQREAVRFDVEQSYADLIANEASIRTALQAIEAAEEEVRLARLRFTAGVGTQTDRLNAETRFIRARGNVLSAIIGYNQAVSSLIRSVSNVAPGTVIPPREAVTLPELRDDLGRNPSDPLIPVQDPLSPDQESLIPSPDPAQDPALPIFDVPGDRIPVSEDGAL